MTPAFDPQAAARRLLRARQDNGLVPSADVLPPDRAGAFTVQDASLAGLGAVGGWKVGAKSLEAEPTCAPLPAAGIFDTGAVLQGPAWRLRCVEVELAFRLGRDLAPSRPDAPAAELAAAIDCVLPVIEVVETRLADWRGSPPLAQMADLQSHGAMVLGAPCALRPIDADLRILQAYLAFDGQPVASTRGANPAADVWRLLGWLAFHCAQRGLPLRAGQLVTTGSCTGMLYAPEGAHVQAQLDGLGGIELRF